MPLSTPGTDLIGPYQEICFAWRAGIPMTAAFASMTRGAAVLFTLTYGQAAENSAAPFPRSHHFPPRCIISASATAPLRHRDSNWKPTARRGFCYDDHANAALISPADNFLIASNVWRRASTKSPAS